ncbi:MAG TPA: ATP-binding protein [Methanofastidiosum sp.]|nr:ATP-binding protein [Methanofastidiosum sp.]HNU61905.1 ATP-binding protein [Methanofastidiosum sp.]HOI77761.1 ATP-binding protein [Methanofastidiosum sp.]
MILSIASGKGGTGKTTVSVNLALSLDRVQLIDCDVEEPNDNIFIKARIENTQDVKVEIPEIDCEKCLSCGKCADFCNFNAIIDLPSGIKVFSGLCHSCGGCKLACPNDAINWADKKIGVIRRGTSGGISFFEGILDIGEVRPTPIIKALKYQIRSDIDTILDCPPGTSCSFLETVNGSDFCVLVTEPTPFGFNDLKIAVEALKEMRIPFGVIINRDGIGDDEIELFCKHEMIPILLKIPYNEDIAKLYSKGEVFLDYFPEISGQLVLMFNNIKGREK